MQIENALEDAILIELVLFYSTDFGLSKLSDALSNLSRISIVGLKNFKWEKAVVEMGDEEN